MEHHERADELEQEAAHAGEASERVEQQVQDLRDDWAAKKSDESVPGATEREATGPHQLEGEDPTTGEQKGEERQEELEEAARTDAEREAEED